MLPSYIIGLREGVEAALIVSIVATFLRQEGRRDALGPMWLGVAGAVAICVALGVLLQLIDEELPQRQQEGLETVIGAVAVGIVTFMVVWMRRHARDLSGTLKASAGAALAGGSAWALVGMAFFAVIREGLETVVFLLAVFQNADDPGTAGLGAVLGLLSAVAIGAGIYLGGVRLDLQRFFRLTGLVLVVVAAGLVVSTLHTAHEAGWLNAGQGQALDLTWLVVPGSWTSALLTGMLGWQPSPVHLEVAGYLLYLVPGLAYVLWPAGLRLPGTAKLGTAASAVLALLALGACGSSSDDPTAAGVKRLGITLTDAGCDPAQLKAQAGPTTFKVTNGGTGRVSEMEVLQGSRILGEKENLIGGLSGSFTLNLKPGRYTISCPGGTDAATGLLDVGGQAVASTSDPRLQAATAGYQRYVASETDVLLKRVGPFVAAVKSGDVAKAKSLFAGARVPYETIEPVAESFGNLDPEIDARVNDVKPGTAWTGFHRIEQALWERGSTKGMAPIADKLLADCKRLAASAKTLTYEVDLLANGANGLLDEVATSKITGEEDRYSHTDLSDFQANLSGSQTAYGLLAPAVKARDAALAGQIGAGFAAVQAELDTLKDAKGAFPSYATVGQAQRKRLSELVAALAKPLATVPEQLQAA